MFIMGCIFLHFMKDQIYLQFCKTDLYCSNLQFIETSDPLKLCLQILSRRQLQRLSFINKQDPACYMQFSDICTFIQFSDFFTKCLYKLVWLQNCNLHPLRMNA